jgi:PAS domain S-box-containing protein
VNDQFRLAIDTIPGLVWSSLPDGYVDFLNDRWCRYTGMQMEEAAGWGWQVAVYPQDLPGLLDTWRAVLSSGEPGEAVARLRRFDGEIRWFLFRAMPLHDESGAVVKWYGETTDIEDRKRAEALLAGEKRLLEMIAKGDALHTILDALCRLVNDNAYGCHCAIMLVDQTGTRLKHGAAPSIPLSYNEGVHGSPVDPSHGPSPMAAFLTEQVIVSDIASDARWNDSGWRELALANGLRACWSTPVLSLEGEVLGTLSLYADEAGRPTTQQYNLIEQCCHIASIAIERAQSEETLRRSEANLTRAQRLSATGSFAYNAASGQLTLSEETLRICEFDRGSVVTPEAMRDRIHPDDVGLFRNMLADTTCSDFRFNCRLRLPDGRIKHLQVAASTLHDNAFQVVEWVGAVRDITEQRVSEDTLHQVRAELAHVSRAASLGALTASIAHEINQPLSGIVTNASTCVRLLADDHPNIEGARETARRTIRDANRAADVIARLRALFRKKSVTVESLDLNQAIREVIALLRRELEASRVSVRTELSVKLRPIGGDRVQLQQVVLNLILNAVDAMSSVQDRPRRLLVKTAPDDADHIRVIVEDSGVGLDPEHAGRIFEAFHTSKSEGMGMGLSISRSIVESHRGRLWAESSGSGATFMFTLPTSNAVASSDPENSRVTEPV